MLLRETKKYKTKDGKPRKFYGCSRYPDCKGTHGAHPNGKPLGVPADTETKQLRMDAHKLCGKIWGEWNTLDCDKEAMYSWLKENAPRPHIAQMRKDELLFTLDLLRKHEAQTQTGETNTAQEGYG